MNVITNDDLKAVKDDTLRKFYQCVRGGKAPENEHRKSPLPQEDLKMTLRYAHLAPSHMVRAVDILDRTINEIPTSQRTSQFTSQSAKKGVSANA
jgi:hypothetical protein